MRRKAYSLDIRWRVVWQRLAMEASFADIASRLQIAPSTAHRIFSQFKETGNVTPMEQPDLESMRKLDEHHELLILVAVSSNPSLYLQELCELVRTATGVSVSGSTVCRLLRRNGFTRKKVQQVAKQRCTDYRAAYMAHILQFPKECLVFVDETGCAAKDQVRKFGYSLRGEKAICHRYLARGKRVSAITAISSDGLLGVELTTGTNSADNFADFVRGTLVPNMQPFNGHSERSVAVMDNCSIHHVHLVMEIFRGAGILVIFLPPYSPDYNPIELTFSSIKSYLKDHDTLLEKLPVRDAMKIILAAFDSITPQKCDAWIRHCGYE
ncbi:MAG: IS630 family transposase [Gammaproteobacteria bacterium]|nr:IS630 family transposase [Gammaproteobacteria bacterium]